MNSKKGYAGMVCLMALFGCNDGSNDTSAPTTKTGKLIDSAVVGVSYKTQSQTGLTNQQGEFNYLDGESITFSIGQLNLPTTQVAEVITPYELANTADKDNPQALNIARFLQTLDEDGNPDNGIVISEETSQKLAHQDKPFKFNSDDFESEYQQLVNDTGINNQLVTEQQARQHMYNSLAQQGSPTEFTTEWLEGRDLYLVFFGEGDIGGEESQNVPVVARLTHQEDGSVEYVGLLNDDNNTTNTTELTYTIEDGSIVYSDNGDEDYSELLWCGANADYLTTYNYYLTGDEDTSTGIMLIFHDKQKALNFAKTLTAPIEDCREGK